MFSVLAFRRIMRQAAAIYRQQDNTQCSSSQLFLWVYAYVRRARLRHSMSSVRLSVRLPPRLSVTFRYREHIGSNTSKIISRPYSLRHLLTLTPTWTIWPNGNTPKIHVEYGWGHEQKHAISLKRCKIGPRLQLLWRTNKKSHTHFQLIPKSVTLDDLELPKRWKKLFTEHIRRNEWR